MMKRKNYKNNIWYPIIDEGEYWVEEFPEEFPNCRTIVTDGNNIFLNSTCYMGWGTMAKSGNHYFMIIKKP